jgi:hypothetical protein
MVWGSISVEKIFVAWLTGWREERGVEING